MEDMLIGVTDRTVLVFIPDPASTTGAGKTGLAAAAVTVTYTRVETDNDVVHTDVTSSVNDLSALTDAHADWGWKEVSATLSKGLYRLDIADAVFASGAWSAVVQVTITSGTAAATPKAFRLVSRNDLDGANLGLTDIAAILVDTGTTLDGRIPAALGANGNMKSDLRDYLGSASPPADTAGYIKATIKDGTGTGELDTASGAVVIQGSKQTLDVLNDAPAVSLASIWDRLTSALTAVGSIGKLLVDNVDAAASTRATPAQVNAEVVDALNVDTYAEPGQGAPAATASLVTKLGYVYKNWRNRKLQTATQWSLLNDDAVTVDQKAAVADDGTTASKGEIATGP